VLKMTHDDDKNYHTISKNHEKSISDIRDKSSKIIQDFSKESDINNIKNELQKNISESQKHNSDINQYLSKIENIYNILKLNKIQKIIDKVKEYNDEIEKNNKKINDELRNSKTLIKKLEEDLNLKECQSKIKSTIDDNYVGECIKNITGLKTYILNEENNINTYFKNAEEYNKIVLLNFNNIEMADTKSQYILNIKTNNGTNSHDYNINELKGHKHKSNGYKDEADKNTKAIKKNKELFEKYKQDVTVLLNKYFALALKNKFDKTKTDSEQIIKEIKETHKNCISQSDKSEQKMNEIKNEQIHIEDEIANNDKSNKAILNIQLSVEPFETKFLKIKDIRKKSDGCLKETENIEKQISTLSIDSQETKLKENANEFDRIVTHFKNKLNTVNDKFKNEYLKVNEGFDNISNSINNVKNSTDENSLLDILNQTKEIYANIVSKKYYSYKYEAENIFRNISKLANSLNIQIKNSSGIDLLENINIAILPYLDSQKEDTLTFIPSPQRISETYTKISDSYNILLDILKKSQELHKKEQQTLNLILEFDRIVTHFKNKLNTVNDKFKNEYSKVNEGFDNISNSINNVKNSTDENLLLNILNQTKEIYDNIVSKKYYSYKYEAENIFKNISKLASSLNIQIQNSSGIDLHKNINIAILSYLDSQTEDMLTFIPSPQKTSETYTKISDSYNTLLDIFKKSQELQKKEQRTLNLILENRRLYEKIQATNELKGTLSDLKYKKEKILNEVKLLLHKSNELNKLSCNSQN
ncbi:reticulocyte binding protein, putative, partial [Plasmodium berghei]